MEWLSKSTKRLLAEMSAGIIFYNVILVILAVLLLPKVSYPVVPVIMGLVVGASGAICMLVHMADRSSGSSDRSHGHESRRIPAATGSQNFRWKRTGSFCARRYFRQ